MRRIKIKISTILSFLSAIALGVSLFWVSQQVQILEREKRILQSEIQSEEEGVRVLLAEWDYLNRPDRIETLAKKYLDNMTPVEPENLLMTAKSVPEPQLLKQEDEMPIPVSTQEHSGDTPKVNTPTGGVARPIVDKEDKSTHDFNRVLKETTEGGNDE
jgi:hypothetical protein